MLYKSHLPIITMIVVSLAWPLTMDAASDERHAEPTAFANKLQRPPNAKGPAATFPNGRCVNIEGVDGLSSQQLADAVDQFRASGIVSVRLPFLMEKHGALASGKGLKPEYVEGVAEKARVLSEKGLNVVVDLHRLDSLYSGQTGTGSLLAIYWKQLSSQLSGLRSNVYFEILNEPKSTLNPSVYAAAYESAISEIRKYNPERVVIVGAPWMSHYKGLDKLKIVDDPNVVYSFHYYDPMNFTHQNAEWIPKYKNAIQQYNSADYKKNLDNAAESVERFIRRTGKTPFLGEFGVIRYAEFGQKYQYIEDVSTRFASLGVQGCLWAWSIRQNAFSIKRGDAIDEDTMKAFASPRL